MRVEQAEQVQDGGAQRAAQPQITEAQQLLNRIYRGAGLDETGTLTPETREAIEDFQRSHDLPVTGRPDASTAERMRRVASWIAHEQHTAGRGESDRGGAVAPTDDAAGTHGAMLASRLQAQVAKRAAAASPVSQGADSEVRPLGSLQAREATDVEKAALEVAMFAKPELRWAQELADRYDKTVVVSLAVDASEAIAGGDVGGGIYFGPDGEVGLTGSGSAGVVGSLSGGGASLTLQVTVLDAGPEALRGKFFTAGGAGTLANNKAGAARVLDANLEPVGWTVEYGASSSGADLEGYFKVGYGVASDPVKGD